MQLQLVIEYLNPLIKITPHTREVIRNEKIKLLESLVNMVKDLAQRDNSKRRIYETVVKELRKVKDETFVDEITPQEMKEVFEALQKDGLTAARGSFGGHWYRCPNGHIYAVGECGGPMQRGRCNECGAEIGGVGHVLNEGNSDAREFVNLVSGPNNNNNNNNNNH